MLCSPLGPIVDIVGGCVALELLGKPRVLASQVVEGTGWINCAHGRFPIPAPATLEILSARGVSLTQCEEPQELVTPTGAALLAEKRLQGSNMGSNRFRTDMPFYIDLYRQGRLKLDELLAEHIDLDDINEGYAQMKKGETARSVIMF